MNAITLQMMNDADSSTMTSKVSILSIEDDVISANMILWHKHLPATI